MLKKFDVFRNKNDKMLEKKYKLENVVKKRVR